MPGAVNLQPFLGAFFAATNLIPNGRVENFCAATSDRTEAGASQKLQGFGNRNAEDPLGEVTHFDRSKGFDMEVRIQSAQATHEIQVPVLFQGGMQSTDHVNFSYSKTQRLGNNPDNFINRIFEGVRVPLLGRKRAKLTGEHANV